MVMGCLPFYKPTTIAQITDSKLPGSRSHPGQLGSGHFDRPGWLARHLVRHRHLRLRQGGGGLKEVLEEILGEQNIGGPVEPDAQLPLPARELAQLVAVQGLLRYEPMNHADMIRRALALPRS